MSESRIGIGVVGFAHGHLGVYCSQMKNWDDVRLVAAWDDHPERGPQTAERFGMEYTPHVEDVLGRSDIDAVMIGTETNKHADYCVAAAEAGKNILLQKPMALSLEDCDRIIEAVDRTGVHFQMAFQMRCDPVNQQMKQLVADGTLGKIGTLRRRHCLNLLFKPEFFQGLTRWHIDPVANMGMFMDDAVHAADFIYWLLGKPVSVMAEIDNILTDVAPDDTGEAIYRFEDGAMALLYNASVTWASDITTEIYGDKGVAIQHWGDGVSTPMAPPDATALKTWMAGEPPQWHHYPYGVPKSHGERIAAVPRPWIDTLKAGKEPTITARDGKVSVEMILAAYESSREGRRVYLSRD